MVLLNLSKQFYWEKKQARIQCIVILGDAGAVSRVDKMFLVNVYCKIESPLTTNILSTRLTASGSTRMCIV